MGRTNVVVKSSNGQKLMNEAKYLLMRVNHDEQLGNPCVILLKSMNRVQSKVSLLFIQATSHKSSRRRKGKR